MKLSDLKLQASLAFDELLDRVLRAVQTPEESLSARALELEELESRVLLSASPAAAVMDAALLDPTADPMVTFDSAPLTPGGSGPSSPDIASADATDLDSVIARADQQSSNPNSDSEPGDLSTGSSEQSVRHELVFIDTGVDDVQQLLDDLWSNNDPTREFEVVQLQNSRDGIEQITAALAGRSDLDAVHIVSHGTDRAVKLGSTWLTQDNLSGYAGEIAGWGNALSADGDLLFYGCDLAASSDGQLLVDSISTLTGADVAASVDDTGAAVLSGDWDLEYSLGSIETHIAFSQTAQDQWGGLLNTFVVTTTADSGAGSLRQAIIDANALGGTDTIEFNIGTGDSGYTDPTPGAPGSGDEYWVITPGSFLGVFTDPIFLDATTQPGYDSGSGRPVIEIDGSAATGATAILDLRTNDSTIRGFALHSSADEALEIDGQTGFGDNNTIQGNWVGLDAEGNAVGNTEHGIAIAFAASGNLIGGTGVNEANVFAGNTFSGIFLRDVGTDNNIIQGNLIGVLPDGVTAAGNGRHGIEVSTSVVGTLIGGTSAGEGNVIRNSALSGVSVVSSSTGNTIVGNEFLGNSQISIDLGNDGVTSNDSSGNAEDQDTGANNLQNHPDLQAANLNGTDLTLKGRLRTDGLNTQYRIEFYGVAAATADPTGHGEGESFLGATTVTTDVDGRVDFDNVTLSGVSLSAGDFVTATATEITDPAQIGIDDALAYGDTSEFESNFLINVAPTISAIGNQSTPEDTATGALAFTIGDAETAAGSLIVTAASNNQTLIPNANITLGGSGTSRTIDVLPASNESGGPATITITVDDGTTTTLTTFGVTVNAANDAPVGIVASNFSAINEDDFTSAGKLVSAFTTTTTDVDLGSVKGIAIIDVDNTNGTWEYTLNGTNWFAIGNVSDSMARLLPSDATARVRFVPDPDYNGVASPFTVVAWDQTSGVAGGLADASTRGGISVFSTASATVGQAVNAVNDDPSGSGSLTTTSLNDNAGATSLFGGLSVTDVDAGETDLSLTITVTDPAAGTISGGGFSETGFATGIYTATGLTVATANTALDSVMFTPTDNTGQTGSFNADIGVTVDDQGGSGDQTVLAPTTVTITRVNDAPLLDFGGSSSLTGITEDDVNNPGNSVAEIVASAGGDRITDVDVGAVEGIAIFNATSGNGAWEYSLDNGSIWNSLGSVSSASSLLLRDIDRVRFVPNGFAATSANIGFRAWDQTSDAAGNKVNSGVNGGSTAFSTTSEFAFITVTDVNDAPTITAIADQTPLEDTATGAIAFTIGDVETAAGSLVVTATSDNQTLVPDANITLGGSGASRTINILPGLNQTGGPATITVTVDDGTTTTQTTFDVTVTADNDAPVASIVPLGYGLNEDASATPLGGVSVSDVDAGTSDISATVSVSDGVLNLTTTTGLSFTGGANGSSSVTVQGTVANLNAALATLTYEPDSNFNGADTLTLLVDDLGNTGGGSLTSMDSASITVTAVNDAAVLDLDFDDSSGATGNDFATNFVEGAGPVNLVDADSVLADVDDANLVSITVVLTNRLDPASKESLAADTTGTSLNAVWDSGSDTLTISGPGILADYQTVLNRVQYDNTAQNPDATDRTITFVANDGTDDSLLATTTLSFSAVNDAPVITSDGGGATVALNVAENATSVTTVTSSDVDGGSPSYSISGGADIAGFSINSSTGELTFISAPDFESPTDTNADNVYEVTVEVSDGAGGTDSQEISVSVTDINEVGVSAIVDTDGTLDAVDENAAIGTSVGITAFANDADATTNGIVYTLDDDAAGQFAIDGSTGVVTVAGTIDREAGATRNIIVRATSDDGSSTTNGFNISVVDQNDNAPVITASQSFTLAENTPNGTGVGTVVASDADTVGTLQNWTITGGNTDGVFAVDAATGELTVADNSNLDFETINAYTLTLTVEDGVTTSASEDVLITVTNVNEAPVNSTPGTQTTGEDTPLVFSSGNGNAISISDVDAEGNVVRISLSATNGTLSLGNVTGLIFISGDGFDDPSVTLAGTVDDINAALDGLSYLPTPNFNGGDTLTMVTDDLGNSGSGTARTDSDTVDIVVNAVNDAPVAVADSYSVDEDNTLNVSGGAGVLANDSDIEDDPLTASLVSGTTNGTVLLNVDGSFTYTPDTHFNGVDAFTYSVLDGEFARTETVTLTVNAINDAPVNQLPGLQTVNEDESLVFSAANGNSIAISDVDAASGLVGVQLTATNGTITLGSTGGLTFAAGDGVDDIDVIFAATLAEANAALSGLIFLPDADYNGLASIDVTARDMGNTGQGGELIDQDTVSITVLPINDAPAGVADAYALNEDETLTLTTVTGVLASDSDIDGDTLTVTLLAGPVSGTLTLDADGAFSYTPDVNFFGSDSFSYEASDGQLDTGAVSVLLTVVSVNDTPVTNEDAFEVRQADTLVVASVGLLANDTDVEGDLLSAVLVSGPSNGTLLLNANGSFEYVPTAMFSGEDSFVYRATDGSDDGGAVTVTITVTAVAPPDTGDTSPEADPDDSDSEDNAEPGPDAGVPASTEDPMDTGEDGGPSGVAPPAPVVQSEQTLELLPEASKQSPVLLASAERVDAIPGLFYRVTHSSGLDRERELGLDSGSDDPFETLLLDADSDLLVQVIQSGHLWESLDDLSASREEALLNEEFAQQIVVGTTGLVGTSLTVGYVVWLLRGGSLIVGMMSSLPAWTMIDPMPVLENVAQAGGLDEDGDSLESLLKAGQES